MSYQPKPIYEFGDFRLEVTERRLCRAEAVIPLPPKAFDLLLVLLEHPGHLLEKEELLQAVWPDAIVEEVNLANTISLLRKALGEDVHEPRYIETVPRRGYRFVAAVQKYEEQAAEPSVIESAPMAAPISSAARLKHWGRRHGLAVSLSILLLGLIGTLSVWQRKPPSVAAPPFSSLAVLPFKSLQSDGDDEYLRLGLADTLITKLGGLRQLIVRPTSAVRKYSSPEQDPLAAGREQEVEAVLDASLQRNGERIRVNVRLLKVSDGATLWSYQCDELYCADVFAMQDVISEQVAAALTSELTGEERTRLKKHSTENRAAHLLYLNGRHFAGKRTVEAWQKAIEFYKQALDLDPNYALAHLGLADAYYQVPLEPMNVMLLRSKGEAQKALAIDETLGEAHTALARILWQYEWNWSQAEREFKRALELNPNNAFAHRIYGYYLASMRQHEESVAQLKHARQLDPTSPIINVDIGQMLFFAGQIAPALEQFKQAQALEPNFYTAYERIGMAYAEMRKYEDAIAVLSNARALERESVDGIALFGYTYARWGKREEAFKKLGELKELSRRRYVSTYWQALIHVGLGEKDQAFQLLQKACQERYVLLVHLNVNPHVESLRADPRFAELVRCVGLPQ